MKRRVVVIIFFLLVAISSAITLVFNKDYPYVRFMFSVIFSLLLFDIVIVKYYVMPLAGVFKKFLYSLLVVSISFGYFATLTLNGVFRTSGDYGLDAGIAVLTIIYGSALIPLFVFVYGLVKKFRQKDSASAEATPKGGTGFKIISLILFILFLSFIGYIYYYWNAWEKAYTDGDIETCRFLFGERKIECEDLADYRNVLAFSRETGQPELCLNIESRLGKEFRYQYQCLQNNWVHEDDKFCPAVKMWADNYNFNLTSWNNYMRFYTRCKPYIVE